MLTLQTVVSVLTEQPELAVALGVVLRLARAYQHELSWPEYRTLHGIKRLLVPVANRTGLGDRVLLVTPGLDRDHPEFSATLDATVKTVAGDFRRAGGQLHLINSLKRRDDTHGDPLSATHLVWTVGDEQVEAYLFRNSNGTTDVYVHTETAVDDPLGHLTDGVDAGDEYNVVPSLADSERSATVTVPSCPAADSTRIEPNTTRRTVHFPRQYRERTQSSNRT